MTNFHFPDKPRHHVNLEDLAYVARQVYANLVDDQCQDSAMGGALEEADRVKLDQDTETVRGLLVSLGMAEWELDNMRETVSGRWADI